MESGRFWIGMAAGVVVGAVIYHCARSERAKQMKEELMEKLKCMYDHSGECMGRMAEKVVDAGVKAADKFAERAEEARDKAHALARELKS